MSDRVIRLGGSHIGNRESIKNLKEFLGPVKNRNLIVFSAVPEIFELVENSILKILDQKNHNAGIVNRLNTTFENLAGVTPSEEFKKLTDRFTSILDGIALIGDYSKALKDQVLTFSEKFSAEIILAQWNNNGNNAKLIWPEDIGLKVSDDFGTATFISVNTAKLHSLENGTYLLGGSYGKTEAGKIARAGAAAADYTAAFITKSLGVKKLELWGLDYDFQRADSKIVDNPQIIQRLTYSEASELAYFDHYSFHPRTIEPLETEHVPIHILNSNSANGKIDTIINTETFVEEQIVKSVACSDDISLLKLDGPGVGLKPGILAKVTSKLNNAGINIKSVITSQISINFILEKKKGEDAAELVRQLGFTSVREIKLLKEVTLIGVIGHGMQQNYGVSARIFNAVASNKINVVLSGSGASDLVSYLVVKSADKEKSVREIYNAFFKQN